MAGVLVVFGFYNFFAAIISVRADMVAQMHFAPAWFDSQRRVGQEVVRPVHAAL